MTARRGRYDVARCGNGEMKREREREKRSFNNITVIIPSVPLPLVACPKLSKDLPPLVSPLITSIRPALSIATNFPMLYKPHEAEFNVPSISRNTSSEDSQRSREQHGNRN